MAMKPGKSPRIIAIFIYAFLNLKRILEREYATDKMKKVLAIQQTIAMIRVFINIFGKFRTFLSVNNLM